MLLQELNLDGELHAPLQNDEALPSGLPVKPLNYHTQKSPEPQTIETQTARLQENLEEHSPDLMKRDFNSSSDTYVSDHEENENGRVATESDNDPLIENGEVERNEQVSIVSPSKSIMKTSVSSVSPKKSVVFQPSLDTFHTYTPKEPEITNSPESTMPVNHLWQEVDQSATSLENTASPPAPPPHTSNTITGLLTSPADSDSSDNESDFYRSSHIDSFKNSNLSLNEKLNVFLASTSPANNDDLDTHLDQLGKASQEETDVNIHRLSYHLEDYNFNTEEDPFNALTKSLELYINSAHSSQSSLQSLIDSNRQLQADVVDKSSRGIQFNDGIKGFPDTMAALLIPLMGAEEDSFSDSPSVGSQFSYTRLEPEPKMEAEPSYDQSYNLTEKSILNLLSSASLAEFLGETSAVKTPVEPKDATCIKNEDLSVANSREWAVVTNPDTHSTIKAETPEPQISVKTEESGVGELKKENTNELYESEQCGLRNEAPVVKLEDPHDQCNSREHINQGGTEIENFDDEGTIAVKTEGDGFDVKPRSMSEASDIKREETVQQVNFDVANDTAGEKKAKDGAEIKQSTEHGNEDPFRFGTQPDDSHSDEDFSFSHDGHDPSTEIHTFRVDERAVVPGPVKLVRSADTSTNMLDKAIMSKSTEESFLASFKYDGAAEIEHEANGRTKLDTEHHQASEHSSSSDSINLDEYKDSVEYSLKSLAPPRREHVEPDPSQPSHELKAKELGEASSNGASSNGSNKMVTSGNSVMAQDCDSSVLANSSNVNPPTDIKLPVVETNDNEFADLTEKINEKSASFEESLSAEHDAEKESLNFLSIWHSQLLSRRSSKPASGFYKVPSILKYNTADISQYQRHEIPSSLRPKKFTDVNLVSTRVVSLSFDDLNVSAFLPELSQDSGLEGHFKSLMKNNTTVEGDRTADTVGTKVFRRRSLESLGILSGLDREFSREVINQKPPNNRRRSIHESLRPGAHTIPGAESDLNFSSKKSKFHVPSFEIKRSNSVLSPKNQYNDIFQDGSFVEPTIKAPGMKTLPSMDRDDVKRIMQMKQAMSLEEYSGLKHVGALTVSAMKKEPQDRFESLQQRASIYCDSLASKSATTASKFRDNKNIGDNLGFKASHATQKRKMDYHSQSKLGSETSNQTKDNLHVYGLLSEKPVAIQSADEVVLEDEPDNLEKSSKITEHSSEQSREPDGNIFTFANIPQTRELDSHIADAKPQNQARKVSAHNPFRTSVEKSVLAHEDITSDGDKDVLPSDEYSSKFLVKSWSEVTPERILPESPEKKSARSSPIKIHSPLKVIRQNGSVTGIVLDKKSRGVLEIQELHNKKLRGDKTHLSTVSVPSNILSDTSSKTRVQSNATQERDVSSRVRSRESLHERPQEQGKLFFRVVGLKNVSVPEVKDRNVAFSVTLDNGIHCIKTPNYQLDSNKVDIGKEFELSVSDSLEFILTLKATYSKPKQGYKEVKERKIVKSKNKLGRLFGSKEIVTTTKFVPQDISDPLGNVFATDGSFARCYIDLDLYKSQITGQACNYNLVCFNEWATYTHNGMKVVKKPYQIAQLEVKMLYVPRNEGYEILPTSIKSAYESLDDLKSERSLALEGYLHQEGGDCETWKRRWFKLHGTSLIAHSEFSHKTRARINLAKVAEVIYVDKENITQSSSNYRNFSDILLMENSFKIRFANGELIDFGAPSKTEKALWIKTIQEIVYRNKFRRQPWVKLMQQRNGDKRTLWIEQ